MNIIKDEIFTKNLKDILRFISQDSKIRASKFNRELFKKIDGVAKMPFKYRKSPYYTDERVRDLIFRGYTIPYFIDSDNSSIVILDIFKWSYREQKSQ